MKTIAFIFSSLFALFSIGQDSLGMEGDNLDLHAVLELFKDSKDMDDFEGKLNKEGNEVNNLDLNGDGDVDYIMVIDYQDSTSHAVTLRVPVTSTESQDVAVIEIEEVDGETVNLQIVGDEDLYGKDYFVEPIDDKSSDAAANVKHWAPIKHIYSPKYIVYVSPWRFGFYPKWYKPWKRVAWNVYHPRVAKYRAHYRIVHYRRGHRAHNHYYGHRVKSAVFHNHHAKQHPHHKSAQKKSKGAPAPKATESNRKRPGGTINKNQRRH